MRSRRPIVLLVVTAFAVGAAATLAFTQEPKTPSRPLGASVVSPPVWKLGDEWGYRWEAPSGKGTFVWSVDREENMDGIPHYIVKTGNREIFYRKSDLAFARETVDGLVVRRARPLTWRFVDFPLSVGHSWEMTWRDERIERQPEDISRKCSAEAPEAVTVPAGTFHTFRIVCIDPRDGSWVMTNWYSADVKHLVRSEEAVAGGRRVRELFQYKVK